MPRASWRGFLRLSLVSCPIYLSPETSRTKSIRLHQVWQPRPIEEPEDELPDQGQQREITGASRPAATHDDTGPAEHQSGAATRITLRPHDPGTGEEVEKEEVVKGYEYQRGQFVTFTPDELKALDVESSEIVDLEKFVPRGEIDPVYFNSPYHLYPDGPIAVDTFKARTVTRPTPVIDLMTALKRSLEPDSPAPKRSRGRNRHRARHRCRKAAKAGLMLALRAGPKATVIGCGKRMAYRASKMLTHRAHPGITLGICW
jgi:non-homologous end joining protein Ku